MPAPEKPTRTLTSILPWLLVIGGAIALFASLALSIEKFDALKNPHTVAVCDLNPILSCTTVAKSHQSEVFGFYNPFIGLAGYAAVTAIGVALLAGAKFKRWFWQAIEVGLLFAVGFITWLQFQTLYRIGALCIYCMIVWACTIPMFWYTTLYNFREGHITTPGWAKKLVAFSQKHHGDILVVWLLVIIFLVGKRFWYYWRTLIGL